jgi:photosystem II stability/assembly factor-like uncharacterized protein
MVKSGYVRNSLFPCALILLVLTSRGYPPTQQRVVQQKTKRVSWQELSWKTNGYDNSAINDLAFVTTSHGWALTHAQLFVTNDEGQSWHELLSGQGRQFFSAFVFSRPNSGWIVGSVASREGDTALILHSRDGGNRWHKQHIYVEHGGEAAQLKGLSGISSCTPTVMWAVGSNAILGTVNGGRTWKAKYISTGRDHLRDVVCINAVRAIAIGENGTILYTQDGGETWSRQDGGVTTHLRRIRRYGDSVWIVGDNGVLLQASVNNLRWEHRPQATSETLYDIYVNDGQGWIIGGQGTIFHTTDNGVTWLKQQSPTSLDLVSLYFIDPQRGWVGGTELTLLRCLPL